MTTTITLKQLRANFPRVLEEIAQGREFTVIKRSKPVVKLSAPDEDSWNFDFRDAAHPEGYPADEMLKILHQVMEEKGEL